MSAHWRLLAAAGHGAGVNVARESLTDDDAVARQLALSALDRLGSLTDDELRHALADPEPAVRRRAAEICGRRPGIGLTRVLHDPDPTVAEVAAWACGEHEWVDVATLDLLIELGGSHEHPLVREAALAALGAIGDERALPAILAGCRDVPTVRRRAVLALAPFDGDDVHAAIERALADRDWQVRQAAEDLVRARSGETGDDQPA